MWVPDPNVLVVRRRSPPYREGRDLDHDVSACTEGARGILGGWGGGGACARVVSSPALIWLGREGAANRLLLCFLVPEGNQPTACTLALWSLKFGPTWRGGGGGSVGQPPGSQGGVGGSPNMDISK